MSLPFGRQASHWLCWLKVTSVPLEFKRFRNRGIVNYGNFIEDVEGRGGCGDEHVGTQV